MGREAHDLVFIPRTPKPGVTGILEQILSLPPGRVFGKAEAKLGFRRCRPDAVLPRRVRHRPVKPLYRMPRGRTKFSMKRLIEPRPTL